MAVSAGLGFDVDDFSVLMEKAKAADKALDGIVSKMQTLGNTRISGDIYQYFDKLVEMSALTERMSKNPLNIQIDTAKLNESKDALDKIANTVMNISTLSNGGQLGFFDPQKIYATSQSVAVLQNDLKVIKENIKSLDKMILDTTNAGQENSELVKMRNQLNERLAIKKKEIEFASLTVSEQTALVERAAAQELKVEQSKVNEIIKTQEQLLQKRKDLEAQRNKFDSAINSGKDLNKTEVEERKKVEKELTQVNAKIQQNYREHRKVLDRMSDEANANRSKLLDNLQTRAYTPQEAIDFATLANRGTEYKEALKILENALMNVNTSSKTAQNDIDNLNKKILEMRQKVEDLTAAQHNEQRLQPTIANEYKRLTKELDKTHESMERLKKTKEYQNGEKSATDAMAAMVANEQNIAKARQDIISAQGQRLVEIDQQIANERANAQLKVFEEEAKKEEEYRKKYGTITPIDASNVVSNSQNVENVRQAEEAVRDLKDARDKLNKNDSNYVITVEQLNREIAQQEDYIQSVINAEKHRAAQEKKNATQDAESAIAYSATAKSLKDIKKAIDYLKEARSKEDISTQKGLESYRALTAEVNRQQEAYNRLTERANRSARSLMDTAGQLARKLALVFSVSQIQGYINKLMEVRGEFELQQRSLQAILQNKDEADKLWNKTVELAIRSPFRIKELVTYTKQLAAYRIESGELYNTTKMLADVSAGLGVDMNRLILAYGQVKSATYLRGTELRQFTEAGIPLLEELSKYFTELEGRIVSVGDVFTRISKRMVDFQDVEEIFKRMTQEGGVFFNMQEIQAQTLQGQISNLKDAIDVMLNEIGKDLDGALKNGVQLVAGFVKNWRDFVDVLSTVPAKVSAITLALVKLGKTKYITNTLLVSLTNSTNYFGKSIATFSNRANKIAAHLPNVVGHASQKTIAHLKRVRTQAILSANGLKILRSAITTLYAAIEMAAISLVITGISKLYLKITESTREAERLKKELDAIFSEDTARVKKTVENYKTLVQRLSEVNKGSKEHRDIISQLNSGYSEYLGFIVDEKTTYDQLKSSIDEVTKSMLRRAKTASYEKALQKLHENTAETIVRAEKNLGYSVRQIILPEGRKATEEEIIAFFNFLEKRARDSEKALEGNDFYSLLREFFGDYTRDETYKYGSANDTTPIIAQTYFKAIHDEKREELEIQRKINGAYQDTYNSAATLNEITAAEEEAKKEIAELDKKTLGTFEYDKKVKEIQKNLDLNKIEIKLKFGELTEEEAERQKNAIIAWATNTTEDINDKIKSALGTYGEEFYSSFLINKERQNKGLSEYEKEVQSGYEASKEIIEELTRQKSAGVIIDEKDLELTQKQKKAWEAIAAILGLDLEKKKKSNKKDNKIIEERVRLVKEMNQEYEKNRKYMNDESAEEQTIKAYSDTASKLGVTLSKGWNHDRTKGLEREAEKVVELKDAYQNLLEEGLSPEEAKSKFIETYGTAQMNQWEDWIEGLKQRLIKKEGFDATAAKKRWKDKDGNWVEEKGYTIGHGHYEAGDALKGKTITLEDAGKLLDADIAKHIEPLIKAIEEGGLEINENQFKVLADLAFQTGPNGQAKKIVEQAIKEADPFAYIIEKLKTAGTTVKKKYVPNLQGRADARWRDFQKEVDGLTIEEGQSVEDYLKEWSDKVDAKLQAAQKIKEGIDKLKLFSNEGTIKALEEMLANAKNHEEYMAIAKALDNYKAEILNEIAQENQKALQNDFDAILDAVDLTKELKDLGFSEDVAKLFGFEFIDEDQARERIEGKKEAAEKLGKEGVKIYEKAIEQITNKENKDMKDRMKTYSKYLMAGYSERLKLKLEEMKKLKEIDELEAATAKKQANGQLSDEQKAQFDNMRKGVGKEAMKEFEKQQWTDFKNSETYTMMFNDLERYGTKALEMLREKIELVKGSLKNLDSQEVKEIITQLNKIDDVMIARNPSKALNDLRQRKKDRGVGTFEEETKALEEAEDREKAAQREIEIIQKIQYARASNITLSEEELKAYDDIVSSAENQGKTEQEIVNAQQENVDAAKAEQLVHGENLSILNSENKAVTEKISLTNKYLDEISKGLKAVKTITESIVGSNNEIVDIYAEAGMELISIIESAIALQIAIKDLNVEVNTALGPIGWIVLGLEAVAAVLKAIFSAKDKALELQMEEYLKKVENLQEEYEKLEKKIDEAYDTKRLEAYSRETQRLTNQMIAAQKKAIDENDKRKQNKTVKERGEELRKELDDLYEQQAESLKDLFSKATDGILDETLDAARSFVDAWYDAFKETGDGLKGLEDNFDEMILNMLKQQAAQSIVGSFVKTWTDDLKNYINPDIGDLTLTAEEAKKWATPIKDTLPKLSDLLRQYFEATEGILSNTNGNGLTAMQKGIQGVTEAEAEVIESYLNSLRSYVAMNGEQLREHTKYLKSIWEFFDAIGYASHPSGGFGLRVVI